MWNWSSFSWELLNHGLPACRIGSLNRVLRTTAWLVGCIPKFGQVTEYIWDELHWLPYPHRIAYRISALVRRCIEGLALPYLLELCCSITQTVSAPPRKRNLLFSARRMPWGSAVPFLLLALRSGMDFLSLFAKTCVHHSISFLSALKNVIFDWGWAGSASE